MGEARLASKSLPVLMGALGILEVFDVKNFNSPGNHALTDNWMSSVKHEAASFTFSSSSSFSKTCVEITENLIY